MQIDSLYYGDCLAWMQEWPGNSVDLIYLDPPFNSSSDYNILYGSSLRDPSAQTRAFADTWAWDAAAMQRVQEIRDASGHPLHILTESLWALLGGSGMMAYLSYMMVRLLEMHRLLKPNGSLYLHCDPTASHYLKIVMDAVFGKRCFRNEIIWSYRRWPARQKNFQRMHDTIFRYGKSDQPEHIIWNQLYEPLAESTLKADGGKKILNVFDPSGRRVRGNKTGEASPGAPLRDVWEIGIIAPTSKERLGYPTQKPLKLLEFIIEASSNADDLVLDPFCGCGTTVDAARMLKRRWIGIDISSFAIDLIRERRLKDSRIPAYGMPADMESTRKLARERPLDFESWAITRIPGMVPNDNQTRDGGIDGRGMFNAERSKNRLVLAQVKGGRFNLSQFRDFLHVFERDKAALGIYVTLDPVTSTAAKAAAAEKGHLTIGASRYPCVQMWSLDEYFTDRAALPVLPPMLDPFTGRPLMKDFFTS